MVLRDLQPGDAGWVLEQHGAHYMRSDGFGADFEAQVARLLARFLDAEDRAAFRGWIATNDDAERLGCVFMDWIDARTSRLRMFFVVPAARGTGVAQALLEAVQSQSSADGARSLRISTHQSHTQAGRLYARNGFSLLESRPVRSFGQDMVEQTWEKQLSAV